MRRRLVFVLLMVLVLIGAGLAYANGSSPLAGSPTVLLGGVPIESGIQEVPPHPKLTLRLPPGAHAGDYRAALDGRDLAIVAAATAPTMALPAMPQASWHHLELWRQALGIRLNRSSLAFRTAEPLQLAAAWLAGTGSVRVDVSWSRPLQDPAPLEAAMRAAGASVDRTQVAIVGRWPASAAGTRLSFSVPAGFSSSTGSYLATAFAPALTVPTVQPYSEVQLSTPVSVSTAHLKLQAYYESTPTGRADLAAHARQLDILTPDFYGLGGDGHLYSQVDAPALEIARQAGVEVQPLVTNINFDGGQAHALITRPGGAGSVATSLIDEAKRLGYTGYQLDFENLSADDRSGFTTFSSALARQLGAAGLKYSAAVIPRKQSSPGGLLTQGSGYSAPYDYAGLSHDARWLSLMAYDQHTSGTPPGAVAALDWVRELVQGTSGGVDRGKLYLGVPLYYRDWALGSTTSVGPYSEALQLAVDNGAGIGWDFQSGSAYVRYSVTGAEHVFWMDNRTSLAEKIAIAKEMGFAGVSAWRLGFEDPGFWDLWAVRH